MIDRSKIMSQLTLFLCASVFLGAVSGVFETSFNNYLNEIFKVTPSIRGWLEFPRELPGFLVALLSGLLFFLPVTRMAAVTAVVTSLGLLGLGHFSNTFDQMTFWMILYSVGTHLYMPVADSLAIQVSPKGQIGKTMGMINGVSTAATIIGCSIVWFGLDYFDLGYSKVFLVGAILSVGAVISFSLMNKRRAETIGESKEITPSNNTKFVFKKEYSLFYWLHMLFGIRKQVFITFGPWVLIKVFDQPASIIARLWIASAILGIFFKPALGRAIDAWGEKKILKAEAIALVFVCAGYGFARLMHLGNHVVWVLYCCYIADQLLFAVGMARTTYLNKIIVNREELMPTLSMGITINHAISMLVPSVGGLVWGRFGYEWVFVGAAFIAVANYFVAGFVRLPSKIELDTKLTKAM